MIELPAADLADFGPLAERVLGLNPDEPYLRLRATGTAVQGFVRLAFDVLAGRSLARASSQFDVTVGAAEFRQWLDEPQVQPPARDAHWLAALPPAAGWQRIEVVPDEAIREVVRSGALLARSTTSRAGQQTLLSSIVLTATAGTRSVEVPLGPLSALTRMGFLPRGGQAAVDIVPGWIRVAAGYGSTYVSTGSPLNLLG
ncbi:MAG TPA: hypothetical protein VHO01_10260 [Jatrophihabitans sp.]|nr:hypothetical protein [Jatrophihabitans sp.]